MLGDGLAARDSNVEVKDIAEVLLESLNPPSGSGEPLSRRQST
jgi:hypothetical protein